MDEDEYEEPSEVDKSIYAWRQSERKVMIDTVSDLIRTSHKVFEVSVYSQCAAGEVD